MAKKRRSEVDVVFYTLKPANNAIAGNSDEVIYSTPIPAKMLGVPFVVYPWGKEKKPRLINHEIIFNVFQLMSPRYLNVTDRQTDGRMCQIAVAILRSA